MRTWLQRIGWLAVIGAGVFGVLVVAAFASSLTIYLISLVR